MKVSLEYELFSFFVSVILALLIGLVYDFFRALRRNTKKDTLWDIVMWILVLMIVAYTWFVFFEGKLRWYTILGAFLSGFIYFLTLSKYVCFLLFFLVDKICSFFCIIFKILLTPLRFLCKIICVYTKVAKSKFSKKVEGKYDEKNA